MPEKPFELTPEMRIPDPVHDYGGNPADKARTCDWSKQEAYLPTPAHVASRWKPVVATGAKTLAAAFAAASLTAAAIVYDRGSSPYDLAEKASEAAEAFIKSLTKGTSWDFR